MADPVTFARKLRQEQTLTKRGYRVFRFTNTDVMQRGEGVFVSLTEVLGEPGTES